MNIEERFKIYEEIKKEIKEKFKEDFSIEEIDSIVQSQFKIMSYGFTKNLSTIIPHIGKFVPIDKDYYDTHIINPNKKLQQELIDEGREMEAREAYLKSMKQYKGLISEKRNAPLLDANEVISIVNIDNVPDTLDIFKNLR